MPRSRVVPGEVLELAPLCNDLQTHPEGIMQWPKMSMQAYSVRFL